MASHKEVGDKERQIAKDKTGFYLHFAIYLIVNLFLFIQWWYITGGEGFPWVITTTVGWGIGVAAHFLVTYSKVKEYQKLTNKKKYRLLG